ncbi:MAG: amidohydrolase family protein [Acidobacteria bacterium]|nr:amidohydrolase family protein [Acidobacteriota bacterium]
MIPAIDAHHHLWIYSPEEYGWIGGQMSVLKRDYVPADLRREMEHAGVTGSVAVQARQTIGETEWLLDLAAENDFLLGVVGWAPLTAADLEERLGRLSARGKLKSVRHVLEDEPDDQYMLRPDFQRGIARLRPFGLVYDILIRERQLPAAVELVDAHPEQVFVLDHIAKPRIKERVMEPWRTHFSEIAHRPNVYCKLSGMATEADWGKWTVTDLRPYFEIALDCFGPGRLMFGSDWPVLRLAGEYSQWAEIVRQWIGPLSDREQRRILFGTACDAYSLTSPATPST